MSSAYLLIALSLLLLGLAVWAFFWAVDSGQFDDLDEKGAAALEGRNLPEEEQPPSDVASKD